ncbi:hypothetical protein HMPREF1861_00064 [Corynebacterium kroppenstedtii]|nr:hypothetical protein HMPREF1861_00064 [Corynebacterium kroppenstedtii]
MGLSRGDFVLVLTVEQAVFCFAKFRCRRTLVSRALWLSITVE